MSDTLERIKAKLDNEFSGALLSATLEYDFPVFDISKSRLHDILAALKTDGFIYLTTACGIHIPDNAPEREFGMIYHLHNLVSNERIRLKTFFSREDMHLTTITDLWDAANWMEREAYDFYGFVFDGHPDLRRLLNMEEMNYHPLRKEYPLEDLQREDKNDKMFGR